MILQNLRIILDKKIGYYQSTNYFYNRFTGHKIMKAPAIFSELALANIDALASGEVDGGGGGRAGVGCPIWEITITIGPSGQTRTCHTEGQYICTDGLPCIK